MSAVVLAELLDVTAAAVEADARAHDQQRGSCPEDLYEAGQRAKRLRLRAEQLREVGG